MERAAERIVEVEPKSDERDIIVGVERIFLSGAKIDREKLPENFSEIRDKYADIIMQELDGNKLSPDDAFYKLQAMCDPSFGEFRWDCKKNQNARIFMRQKAIGSINDLLTDPNYRYTTPAKEVAAKMARHYAKLGILDLDEDHNFFERLTTHS